MTDVLQSVHNLVSTLVSCSLDWVRRSCNVPTHIVAKVALNSICSFCFGRNNLLMPLRLSCMANFPAGSSLF